MFDFNHIICDIEGTVTSISFVKDVLFPYAYDNVESFLKKHFERKDVQDVVHQLIETSAEEAKTDDNIKFVRPDKIIETLTEHVRYWITNDRKLTALKELQGLMWEEAYKSKEITGHIYSEVKEFFQTMSKRGKKIWIYSSGSIKAQKLLFKHSDNGDLTLYISGYYDTTTGHKQDPESYKKIAAEVGGNTESILFLTDVIGEARAARAAGMNVVIMIRPGNKPLTEEEKNEFNHLETLDNLFR